MQKGKKVFAVLGLIFLVGLILVTFLKRDEINKWFTKTETKEVIITVKSPTIESELVKRDSVRTERYADSVYCSISDNLLRAVLMKIGTDSVTPIKVSNEILSNIEYYKGVEYGARVGHDILTKDPPLIKDTVTVHIKDTK